MLPSRKHADEMVRLPLQLPDVHPRGVPSLHNRDANTGFDTRGEWFDANSNVVPGLDGGIVPTSMNDPSAIPPYPYDSKFELDGILKQ